MTQFDALRICPACCGARELTTVGLCSTCTRLQQTGRLQPYPPQYEDDSPATLSLQGSQMFEPLFKRTSTGAITTWSIRVEPQDDGTAVIITTHGQVDGAMQEARDRITEGKNPGKKNATTAFEQAVKEAESKWTRQQERNHYGLTVEESEAKKFVAPMLAQSWLEKGELSTYAKQVNWEDGRHLYVQPKYDGHRCLAVRDADTVRLFTRKGVEVTTCGHLVDQLMAVIPKGVTFDGELYTHGVPVTTIGGYIKKQQEGTQNLCFMMYDVATSTDPFAMRVDLLAHWNKVQQSHLHFARTQPITKIDELLEFQSQCLEHGYEGAMFRHGLAGYEAGKRSASLLKVKTFADGEFAVVGCQEGRGKFLGAAIFECVTSAGVKFDCTAPGTMVEKQAYWQNHQQYIGKRLTIKYQKMTETAEPVPFQPVAKGFIE